jgi:DNA-binding transcriptional LysR family regulator
MTNLDAPTPTLRQLELFLSLASSEAIAGAGAKLGMTPSATSHALRALEDTLGVAVVDRNASKVCFTYAGEQILPHVRDVFASLQLIQTTASASAGLTSGLLRLGSFGASSSLTLLPPILAAFKARYPGVEVFVTEKPDAEIEQDLIERRIEIGVVTLPKPELDTQTLAVDELVAVLPEAHPLASLSVVPLKQLAEHPLVLTHAGSQTLIARMFSREGLRPRVAHELTQLLSILEFVSRGQGISILASLALPPTYQGVVYRKIVPQSSRRVGLACLNEQRLSPAAHALWSQVRKAASENRSR